MEIYKYVKFPGKIRNSITFSWNGMDGIEECHGDLENQRVRIGQGNSSLNLGLDKSSMSHIRELWEANRTEGKVKGWK